MGTRFFCCLGRDNVERALHAARLIGSRFRGIFLGAPTQDRQMARRRAVNDGANGAAQPLR